MNYELKLDDGRVVEWTGTDGEDAARRFVDSERVAGRSAVVVAWREPSARGTVSVLGRARIEG
jgi:hypothetical protein